MNQLAEVEPHNELSTLRDCVSGKTFAEALYAFKDIESVKVRLNVLRDPEHYQKKHAEYDAKRLARRLERRASA